GIQFAYVDGSVRFLSDQSDHALFRATCTRSRGEVFAKAK
ncbi:MAG: H-X9-DG-CTERM domain-containing protein, partial [Pirellulales bacterium]